MLNTGGKGTREPWRRQLERGLAHLSRGDLDGAVQWFERAHGLAPEQPEVCYALGRERLRSGLAEEAETLLRSAWNGDRTLVSAGAELARCLGLELARIDEATEVVHELGDDPVALVVSAELSLSVGEHEAAEVAAQGAFDQAPEDSATSLAAASVLSRIDNDTGIELAEDGDLQQALFYFRRAGARDTEWAAPRANAGLALLGIGLSDRAESRFSEALALDPQHSVARVGMARLLRARGDLPGALRILEPTGDGVPHALELKLRAELLADAGDTEAAAAELTDALSRGAGDAELWRTLGEIFARSGSPSAAEDCLRQAVELDPDSVLAHCQLADLLVREGRYLEAARLAERAQSIDPDRFEQFMPTRMPHDGDTK